MDAEQQLEVVLMAGYDCGGGCSWYFHSINGERVRQPSTCLAAFAPRGDAGQRSLQALVELDDGIDDDYAPLLNPFGLQGWELVRVAYKQDPADYNDYRVLRFCRSAGVRPLWEYAVVVLDEHPRGASSAELVAQRRSEAHRRLAGSGWQLVGEVVVEWSQTLVEIVFKRSLASI